MSRQLPLDLTHAASFDLADFMVSSINRQAFDMIAGWPDWPAHAVALVGPAGCGKTHLGAAWATISDAVRAEPDMAPESVAAGAPVLIEDADRVGFDDTLLFHLFNWTRETGGRILFTARTAPTRWPVTLPDLKSRLATVPVMAIEAPDDDLLRMIVTKLFSDRQLQVDPAVIDYMMMRMDRSFDGARQLVAAMDARSLAGKREITKHLARECLDEPTVAKES
ncbi:DnaA ATPase domain-containing protein [Pseudokordiimonas caeni]|uniref:DnaA ATPase domain-containing protein n=1 Tax=Pseudokordiimonas caeni TaxID=2997908 RepID=UPI0028116A57|nr:DnaA/Hda family protein [Pseudokordiimonas caeni]